MTGYVDKRFVMTPAQWGMIDYYKMMTISGKLRKADKLVTTRQLLVRKGVRGGGTYGASAAAFLAAISVDGGGDFAVCAPTWYKCQDVVKPAFMHWARPYCTVIRDRYCILKNGVRVVFMGMHKPSAIDGFTLIGGWGDEIKDWKRLAFEKANERVMTTGGSWVYTTSPNGYDWIHDEFENPEKDPRDIRAEITFTTYDGVAPREWIDDIASTMDERMYRQQIMGEYVQFAGQVHHGWDRAINLTEVAMIGSVAVPMKYNPGLPLDVFMDFNVDKMVGGIAQRREFSGKPHVFVLDEIVLRNSDTQKWLTELKKRLKAMNVPEHKVTIYPDPSGNQRRTESGGRSNFHIIKKNGFRYKARRRAPSITDRINATNALILDKDGAVRTHVRPHCKEFNASMERLAWDEGKNKPKKDDEHDHMSDAFGYYVEYEYPITYVSPSERQLKKRRRKLVRPA